MKTQDIERLEKVVKQYIEIEEALFVVLDSLADQPRERFFASERTTLDMVRNMAQDTANIRYWVESQIKMFKKL